MSFLPRLQFPSRAAKFIGCWQAGTVHTLATQLCRKWKNFWWLVDHANHSVNRKWKDFWWLVDHANHSVNRWISQVSQPLCGSLLGKQPASTWCHPQFGSGSHMTPQGWPWYSLSDCLLTSHSSCQPVMKLKCQHRHLSFNSTSPPPWTHTHTHTHTLVTLVAPGAPVGSSTAHQ